MSGHSKWSTIKRQKQANDQKRGQAYTKLANAITIAVREGGGITDINSNFKLRIAVDKAREMNMPKDNIERAIERGAGKAGGASFESVVYEGYGPHGTAFIIECATDNKLRTGAQIKHILERAGGGLGGSGSVMFNFDHQGYLFLPKDTKSEDQILEKVIELGALDMSTLPDGFEVYTNREDLHKIKEGFTKSGIAVGTNELVFRAKSTIPIDQVSQAKAIQSCREALEELDDVQRVFTNDDISDEIVSALSLEG